MIAGERYEFLSARPLRMSSFGSSVVERGIEIDKQIIPFLSENLVRFQAEGVAGYTSIFGKTLLRLAEEQWTEFREGARTTMECPCCPESTCN